MTTNYLNILHNLEKVNTDEFELFPKEYDGIFLGATFSISPNYLSKNLKHFEKINIIIGITDNQYQSKMVNHINYKENINNIINLDSLEFVNKLDYDSQQKLFKKRVLIKTPVYPIHSKFFILTNKDKTKTRVIIGSANLTEQGLNNNIAQFEEVLVFDNNKKIYDIYLKRYSELEENTIDFISKSTEDFIKNKIKEEQKNIQDSINVISNSDIDNSQNKIKSSELNKIKKPVYIHLKDNEKEKLINDNLSELHNKLESNIDNKKLPEDILSNIQNETSDILNTLTKEKVKIERVYKVIKKSITPSQKKNRSYKLENNKNKIQKIIKETININSVEINNEIPLQRFNLKRLDNHITNEQIEENIVIINDDKTIPYSFYQNKDSIQKSLYNIDLIIRGYEKYLSKYNDDIGKRIFEVILYSFTAPFISLIRKNTLINESRQHIPLFMFIGGAAGSGKSSLLRCISKMMKNDDTIKDFIDYDRISNHPTQSTKTSETNQNIKLMLQENNVYPILIDEIPSNFFTGRGQDVIVSSSNTIDESNEDYPAFIGTTNFSNYSMNERATRRSYYIKLDTPFIETKRQESLEYYTDIIDKLDTSLFQDFLTRFHSKLLVPDTVYVKSDANGMFDFLSITREIFRSYYEEVGMPLPRYFGDNRLNDYREDGKAKWKDLFNSESKNKNIFNYNKKENALYFKASELDNNQKMHQERRSQIYLKSLPTHIFNGDENAHNIKLNANEFFEWISIKNPYKLFSFI